MSIHAKQHIPNFVTGFEPQSADAIDFRALMCVDWIEHWKKIGCNHFEWSPHSPADDLLMAIMNDGKFWVVAYVTPPGALTELPQWVAEVTSA